MQFNWFVVIGAGIIPLLTGFVWYNPKTFGTAWMKQVGFTEESMQGANMTEIFGLTLLFGIIAAVAVAQMVIHQSGYYSILLGTPGMDDPNSAISQEISAFMGKHGQNFRTFKHGAFHGVLYSLFLVLPIFGINSLFEQRSWTYVFIHVGYWALTLALMGGVICAFA